MARITCMGGWCRKRDDCRLYHNTIAPIVSERLCEPGMADSFEPVRVVRAPRTWELSLTAPLLEPATLADPVLR